MSMKIITMCPNANKISGSTMMMTNLKIIQLNRLFPSSPHLLLKLSSTLEIAIIVNTIMVMANPYVIMIFNVDFSFSGNFSSLYTTYCLGVK